MRSIRSLFFFALVLFASLSSIVSAQPSPAPQYRHFVELYGWEDARNSAAFSHSFASFYRVDQNHRVERVDISWIPQDRYLRGLRPYRMPALGDWPGQNMVLEKTLGAANYANRRVTRFGPYESDAQLFAIAYHRMRSLNAGQYTYRGIDLGSQSFSVNCVHAITAPLGDFRTGIALRGPTASREIVNFMARQGFLVDLNLRADWAGVLHARPAVLNLMP